MVQRSSVNLNIKSLSVINYYAGVINPKYSHSLMSDVIRCSCNIYFGPYLWERVVQFHAGEFDPSQGVAGRNKANCVPLTNIKHSSVRSSYTHPPVNIRAPLYRRSAVFPDTGPDKILNFWSSELLSGNPCDTMEGAKQIKLTSDVSVDAVTRQW